MAWGSLLRSGLLDKEGEGPYTSGASTFQTEGTDDAKALSANGLDVFKSIAGQRGASGVRRRGR